MRQTLILMIGVDTGQSNAELHNVIISKQGSGNEGCI
jgi:hypothetical protein